MIYEKFDNKLNGIPVARDSNGIAYVLVATTDVDGVITPVGSGSGSSSSGSSSVQAERFSPVHFTATYYDTGTVTIAGTSAITSSSNLTYVKAIDNTAYTTTTYIQGSNNVMLYWDSVNSRVSIYSSGTIITTLVNTMVFQVGINSYRVGDDPTNDLVKTQEQSPLYNRYSGPTSWIDTTNVAAATNYYPSSSGLTLDTYKNICIQGIISGGVTATIEVTNDPAGTPDWVDITKSGYDLISNTSNNASFVDTNFLLDFTGLNAKSFRVKSVTSDNTNGVQYSFRATY